MKWQQDNMGNIYTTSRGQDSSLSSIALFFPLDHTSWHQVRPALEGIFRVFAKYTMYGGRDASGLLVPIGHRIWS